MISNIVKIRVIYADTDAMGIVYHANYMKWFEIGRTELCRQMGFSYADFEASRYYLPLTKAYCHYHAPARYDDIIMVETEIADIKRASIRFSYRIYDEDKKNILVEGYTLHAVTDGTGKIVRVPVALKEKIEDPRNRLRVGCDF